MIFRCLLIIGLALFAPLSPAAAQGKFSTAILVGETTITGYQIEQRTRFLTLLGAPGDVRGLAREQLINEAIQMAEARAKEKLPTPEAIEEGMAEFAGRANLDTEKFLQALGQQGVQPETFRDFVTAGLAWRDVVRDSFLDDARASISPDQIGRSLAQTGTDGGLRVLVSEILLPSTTPEVTLASRRRAAEIAALPDENAFAAAARRYSVAPSAQRGGAVNWVDLDGLPEAVRGIIGALSPGQISRPVELGDTIGVFLLRNAERVNAGPPDSLLFDYALFIVGPDRAMAQAVASRVDTCDDLYGEAKGLPEDRLLRETEPASALAPDVRAALATLDQNETTTSLSRGANATVLMLCDRKPGGESTVDFDIVGNRLMNVRMGNLAANHLAALRDATQITDYTR